MAPETSRGQRRLTLLMTGLVYLAVEIASDPLGRPSRFGLTFGAGLFLIALVANRFVPSPAASARWPRWATLILLSMMALPILAEPLLRDWLGAGLPLELRLVHALRALGIGLAAFAAWPRALRLAGVVSLFNMLFVSAIGDQAPIPYLLAAYAVIGGAWLLAGHAARLGTGGLAGAAVVVARAPLRFPLRPALLFIAVTLAAGSLLIVGPKRVVATLGELMPTSGGTGSYDPFARGGINDGDEEVAGDDPRATGFVESDQFLDSPDPALYDVVSDLFGEPKKRPTEIERMMAMGRGDVREHAGRTPDGKRPSRRFETTRHRPKNPGRPDNRAARSLFEVQGRTPLHLRVEAYAVYEAGEWTTAQRRPSVQRIENEIDEVWMNVVGRRPLDAYGPGESHRLKIASLKGALIPTGMLLERFRVGRLNRTDYFAWEFDGVLRMEGRRTVPAGTVIDVDCLTLAPETLAVGDFAPTDISTPPPYLAASEALDAIAREWTAGLPRGWPQIEAVLNRLRSEYVVDRTATAPEHCADPVRHFLTESRRGPDYLFASAAALLLRRLDYPTRLVLGYYVSPDAFDEETDHTPVVREDLHFWPELLLRDGRWLAVEPTPGYAVLRPARSWHERLRDTAGAIAAWCSRHPAPIALLLVAVAAAVWRRRAILDLALVARWRLAPGPTWREAVLHCLRVAEQRGRWVGRGRAAAQTMAAWAESLPENARGGRDLHLLVGLGEWAAYGANLPPPLPAAEVHALCRRVLADWKPSRSSA